MTLSVRMYCRFPPGKAKHADQTCAAQVLLWNGEWTNSGKAVDSCPENHVLWNLTRSLSLPPYWH